MEFLNYLGGDKPYFFFFNLTFLKVKYPIEDSKFREKRSGENNHYCRSLFLTL